MKEILCFGDSNTHGYMPGLGTRYPYDVRWPGVLARLLGAEYHIVEEGMDGRTTAFEDAIQPHRSALGYLYPCLKTHAPLDLVILMLGTNDTKVRYAVSAEEIGFGLQRDLEEIETFFRYNAARAGTCPKILVVSPVPMPGTGGDPELTPLRWKNSAAWRRSTGRWRRTTAVLLPRRRTGSDRNCLALISATLRQRPIECTPSTSPGWCGSSSEKLPMVPYAYSRERR